MSTRHTPFTCPIQGDISRADAVGLHMLCDDRRVVEFGVGASTMILAKCARSLVTYDTSEAWIAKTKTRVAAIEHKTCAPEFICFQPDAVPECPACDVLWIDGIPDARKAFLHKNFTKATEMVILHGALRSHSSFGHILLTGILQEQWEMVQTIELGFMDSHLLVIKKRRRPLTYFNYHQTESFNHRLVP